MDLLLTLSKLKLKEYTARSFKKYWNLDLETSKSRRKMVHNKTLIVIYEAWRGKLIARVFYLEEGYYQLRPYRTVMEVARYLSGSNKKLVRNMSAGLSGTNVNSILTYDVRRVGGWKVHKLHSFNTESVYYHYWHIQHEVHVDYSDVIKDTNVKYAAIDLLEINWKLPDHIFDYLSKYVKYPILEVIVKKGWLHLLDDIRSLRFSKNTLPEIVGLPKQKYWMLDIGLDLKFIRENRCWILDEKLTIEETMIFKREYKLHNTKLDSRTIKYLTNQQSSYSYYSDYIRFAQELGLELNRNVIKFPKDLVRAHDQAYSQIKINKDIFNKEKFKEQYEINKKYEFENEDFMIIVAKEHSELQTESTYLNHCVRSYGSKIEKGETSILFVREKDKPNTPLVTIELKNEKVIQARGKNNCSPSNEIMNFIKSWSEEKNIQYS